MRPATLTDEHHPRRLSPPLPALSGVLRRCWPVPLLAIALLGQVCAAPRITAVRASQRGRDDAEYVSLVASPHRSLAGYSLIVVEGDHGRAGHIDRRIDFTDRDRVGGNGRFLLGVCAGLRRLYHLQPDLALPANYFENSSLTLALVRTVTLPTRGLAGVAAVSALALDDGDPGDRFYFGAARVGPDGKYFPPGARQVHAHWRTLPFHAGREPAPAAGGHGGCRATPVSIPEIQGKGMRSPYTSRPVRAGGVVSAVDRRRSGFWLQAVPGDGDPETSDGVFVHDPHLRHRGIRTGDRLVLTGRVREAPTGRTPPRTEIFLVRRIRRLERGVALPGPVRLQRLPRSARRDAMKHWESLEGMRVRVSHGMVVGPTDAHGDAVVLAPGNVRSEPDLTAATGILRLRATAPGRVSYHPERIMLSSLGSARPRPLRTGDRMARATGVVDIRYGSYRVLVTGVRASPSPVPAASPLRAPRTGTLAVASMNLENLFPPGARSSADAHPVRRRDYERHRDKLVSLFAETLRAPALIVVTEAGSASVIEDLAARLGRRTGHPYHAASRPSGDRRGIRAGFLWRADRMRREHVESLSAPGRDPLLGRFTVAGRTLTVIAVHFRSKYADDPLFCACIPRRPSERLRRRQAARVRERVSRALRRNSGALLLVTGDFNDFAFREPREGGPDPVSLIANGQPPRLTDLTARVPGPRRYSYIYRGNAQLIDHMLASPALAGQATLVRLPHVNAAFPASLARDPHTVRRSSDHDPIAARFRLPPAAKRSPPSTP
ncbi:MAG TPA: endonuclease/exonuclease/phosphatase family protein [Gammaproteobacteria bacterium]|nr:endonuclease/exonuclease/phosphatase family protein [Gammaproteobacteria bacterium]